MFKFEGFLKLGSTPFGGARAGPLRRASIWVGVVIVGSNRIAETERMNFFWCGVYCVKNRNERSQASYMGHRS